MWDVLITIGNLIVLPALLPTILNRRAYVPRVTSSMSVLGISVIVTGMIGAGLVVSPIALSLIGVGWVFIFLFRGDALAAEQEAPRRQSQASGIEAPVETDV